MAKKKEVSKERVNFTLNRALMEHFRDHCEENHLKMSQVVEKLVKVELGVHRHTKKIEHGRHTGIL